MAAKLVEYCHDTDSINENLPSVPSYMIFPFFDCLSFQLT